MTRWIVPLLVALLAVGTVQADNDKGKGNDKNQHNDWQNHGQVVSECNHQANQRNLKGQDRKDFTEWCESRGGRYQYDYNRYGSEKTCYQRANNKGLKGDKRANFLDKCFAGEIGKKNKD